MDKKHLTLAGYSIASLIGILALLVIVFITTNEVFSISNSLQRLDIKNTNSKIQETPKSKLSKVEGYTTDFEMSYPEGFTALLIDSPYEKGRKDLRITSKPGSINLIYPPTKNQDNNTVFFDEGIQIDVRDSKNETKSDLQMISSVQRNVPTINPRVFETISIDGSSDNGFTDGSIKIKPHRTYTIIGGDKTYAMEIYIVGNYPNYEEVIQSIIKSIN